MLQIKNTTPFAAEVALFPNENGIDTLYILVKASFIIGRKWTLMDEQIPPFAEDIYWYEPGQSSLKYASDFHLGKLSTDIIMNGHAFSPQGKEVQQLDVHLSVGKAEKFVRVFGDRKWKNGHISSPQPFQSMPMVYEKAYGGAHVVEGQTVSVEPRNPVGCGFSGKRSAREMEGQPLPNLEHPAHLIRQHQDQPEPACFGFCAPNWLPRSAYVGTYDESWQMDRAPYLPVDFDRRYFSMAPQGLVYPGFIQGGESVSISNMHPKGDMQFNLPKVNLNTKVILNQRVENLPLVIETLQLEPNERTLSMVWKAALLCDKQALKIDEVQVSLQR